MMMRQMATACQIITMLVIVIVVTMLHQQVEATDSEEELRSLQENYVQLNNLLKDKVNKDDVNANFEFAHNLLNKQENPVGPALALFIKLGELIRLYRCNAEDTETLTYNQEALKLVDKKDRVYQIFIHISQKHANDCQEDYEDRFARKKRDWDSEVQQMVSASMDPFIIQTQKEELKKKGVAQKKEVEEPAQVKLAPVIDNSVSNNLQHQSLPLPPPLVQHQSAGPLPPPPPPAPLSETPAGPKDMVSSFFSNFGFNRNKGKVIKKRDVSDAMRGSKRKSSELLQELHSSKMEEGKIRRANVSMLKRFVGAGILFANKRQKTQEQQVEQQQQGSKKRTPSFIKRLGVNLPFLKLPSRDQNKFESMEEEQPTKIESTDDKTNWWNLAYSNNDSNKDSPSKKELPAASEQRTGPGLGPNPHNFYARQQVEVTSAGQSNDSSNSSAGKPTGSVKQQSQPATSGGAPVPTTAAKQQPQQPQQQQQQPKKTTEKLDIPTTKRMIMSGRYFIDKVKGAKLLTSTLLELAMQQGAEFVIKDDKDRAREKKNLDQFVRSNVLEPCEKFHTHFEPVFQVAKFDLKYNGKTSSDNEDFYRSFAEYQLCESFLAQQSELIEKVVTFALEDIVFQSQKPAEPKQKAGPLRQQKKGKNNKKAVQSPGDMLGS